MSFKHVGSLVLNYNLLICTQFCVGWINEYNSRIVPKGVLEKAVRKFMDNFDKEELIRKEKEKNANEPDDEGWTTVTRT